MPAQHFRERLPAEVIDLAERLGSDPNVGPLSVRLSQSGRMRENAGSRWMPFRAHQRIAIRECVFSWTARTGPARLVEVRDALEHGQGEVRVSLPGGLNLASKRGDPELTRGELMRYLAELPWCPDAILSNGNLCWRVQAPDSFIVRAEAGRTRAEVTLNLDADGRIRSVFAPDRPRAIGRNFVPTPWRGQFHDYQLRNRRWLPNRGSVAWLCDGQEASCWEGEILDWRLSSR